MGKRSALRRWTLRALTATGVALLLTAVSLLALLLYVDHDLPSVEALKTHHPSQVTKVTCADGNVCAEYFRERRTWVDLVLLPPHVRNAFLAAEDADFYQHQGLAYAGMIRAFAKTLLGRPQGASTITQQTCKALLLNKETRVMRKLKELVLAPRLEEAFTKDQILELYINEINFGHGRYGVEEAALFYFGKHAANLSLGEAAVLAGTVQLPGRINPLTNIVKAKKRQRYVLGQMGTHRFVPKAEAEKELAKPIVLAKRPEEPWGPYYAEEVRRMLLARYGEDALLSGGLRVDIAMDPRIQAAADQAVKDGLEVLDRRQGYRGALGKMAPDEFARLKPLIARRITEAGKRRAEEVLVADLSSLVEKAASEKGGPAPGGAEEGVEEQPDLALEDEAPPSPEEVKARSVPLKPLKEGLRLVALVTQVKDKEKRAELDLVGRTAELPFASATWARRRVGNKLLPAPQRISDVMQPGELVAVRVVRAPFSGALEVALDQEPLVQGALVVINPENRQVVAMTGGYDFLRSPFNRATQAKRQPGSSFKPFLYGAALASGKYTSLSVMNDAPDAIRDPWTGKVWKPQNYEKGSFDGPMTLRQALTFSKNTVSVRLIESVTPEAVIDFASKAGIRSTLPNNFTLALGTGEVSLLELANAYATLQDQGRYAEPILLKRVRDAQEKTLEEQLPAFEERLPPAVAFLATSLMQSVVESGTATAVQELNRPAAGKTGTASESRDAWFCGYTQDYVACAWVGFDNHESLGPGETGGKAALPIWLSAMKAAEQDKPTREFPVPVGVTMARVDPSTGLLAGESSPGRWEPFLEGTEPTGEAPARGTVRPEDFFLTAP